MSISNNSELSTEDWKLKIINASAVELVGINFELVLLNIDKAAACLNDGDIGGFHEKNKTAQNFLMELIHSLDKSNDVAGDLLSLYFYANKLLIRSYYKKSPEPLTEAKNLLEKIMAALMEAGKSIENKTPLIENPEQVYSGLTYGKSSLNDTVGDGGKRGFKA